MKKRYFIPLLTLSFIVGAILTQKTAFGAGGFKQKIGDTISTSNLIQSIRQVLGTPTENFTLGTDGAGKANLSIKFKAKSNSSTKQPQIYIWDGGSFDFYPTNCGSVADTFDGIYTFPDTCRKSPTGSFLKDYAFQTGHTYKIQPYLSGGSGQFYGASSDVYPNGGIETLDYSPTPVVDLYFTLGTLIENLINITFPENATTTPDFSTWHAEFMVGNMPPVFGKIKINYGLSTSTLNLSDEINFIAYDNNLAPVAIPKDTLLQAGKQYFANAEIIIGTSTIATSSIISFNISGGGGYLENFHYAIPTSTISTTTPPIQITCDPNDNLFQYSLCKLALWLFIPDAGTLNKFSTLTDDIKNKPPIGYFYAVKTAFNGLSSTSTKAFQLANVTPLNNSVFNPLKTGISFILWLGCGIWIFNRIRHIQL
jgi:hypothetical protein